MFKITYYENKINVDIFHSLTDGNSGVVFLKEIVYTYLELAHPEDFSTKLRLDRKLSNNTEDDYLKITIKSPKRKRWQESIHLKR